MNNVRYFDMTATYEVDIFLFRQLGNGQYIVRHFIFRQLGIRHRIVAKEPNRCPDWPLLSK
jgi:hypothetical protein